MIADAKTYTETEGQAFANLRANTEASNQAQSEFLDGLQKYAAKAVNTVAPHMKGVSNVLKEAGSFMLQDAMRQIGAPESMGGPP